MTQPTAEQPTTAPESEQPADTAPADSMPAELEASADIEQQQSPNREAAKWRKQLRTVETERDSLIERVTAYERAEVERLAADKLTDPADLWVSGADLETFRGEDGAIDAAKVRAAVDGVLESHPHWKRATRTRPPAGSLKSGASSEGDIVGTSWAQVFGTARERG
ncbi:hypothetical protein [Nocardia sp. NPDC050412]|uniref:hypothetical protein n=1 Tax=Nocardia sp. NPDC050412 TaxID=3364320 RepID=UPI0037B46750